VDKYGFVGSMPYKYANFIIAQIYGEFLDLP
jgi:hypothetical protein